MKRIVWILTYSVLLLWAPVISHAGEPGFVPLFDGKSLRGWEIKCKPADEALAKKFCTVDDGAILLDSSGSTKHDYVLLATKKEYDNFVLRLRFQTYRDVKGNSGVQIRSRYDQKENYCDGPQVDVHPPGPWRTGMVWDETRGAQGWLYPKIPEGKNWVDESMAPKGFKFVYADQGEGWNDFEITADAMKFGAVLNGVTVLQYDGTGVLDNEAHQKRGTGIKGIVALQIHRGDQLKIRFKDVRIKPLRPTPNQIGD